MEELQDKLDTMRRQEQRYACGDYTQPPPAAQNPLLQRSSSCTSSSSSSCASNNSSRSALDSMGSIHAPQQPQLQQGAEHPPPPQDLLHLLLEECASLVTDPRVVAERQATRRGSQCSSATTASTTSVQSPERGGKKNQNNKVEPLPKSPVGVDETVEEEEEDETLAATTSTLSSSPSYSSLHDAQQQQQYYVPPDLAYWRLQMFDWACMVVDGFHMDRCAVLSTAFNLLDRYTSLELKRMNQQTSPRPLDNKKTKKDEPETITRDDYQLFAMTALYMAVKILEPYPRKMSLETLVEMSRNYYTRQDLVNTELEMLTALKWRTTPPTAILFCRELEPLLHHSKKQTHAAYSQQFMADLERVYSTICDVTVSDPFFLNHRPSVIALATLFHAARLTGCSVSKRAQLQQRGVALLQLDANEQAALEQVYQKLESLYC